MDSYGSVGQLTLPKLIVNGIVRTIWFSDDPSLDRSFKLSLALICRHTFNHLSSLSSSWDHFTGRKQWIAHLTSPYCMWKQLSHISTDTIVELAMHTLQHQPQQPQQPQQQQQQQQQQQPQQQLQTNFDLQVEQTVRELCQVHATSAESIHIKLRQSVEYSIDVVAMAIVETLVDAPVRKVTFEPEWVKDKRSVVGNIKATIKALRKYQHLECLEIIGWPTTLQEFRGIHRAYTWLTNFLQRNDCSNLNSLGVQIVSGEGLGRLSNLFRCSTAMDTYMCVHNIRSLTLLYIPYNLDNETETLDCLSNVSHLTNIDSLSLVAADNYFIAIPVVDRWLVQYLQNNNARLKRLEIAHKMSVELQTEISKLVNLEHLSLPMVDKAWASGHALPMSLNSLTLQCMYGEDEYGEDEYGEDDYDGEQLPYLIDQVLDCCVNSPITTLEFRFPHFRHNELNPKTLSRSSCFGKWTSLTKVSLNYHPSEPNGDNSYDNGIHFLTTILESKSREISSCCTHSMEFARTLER
ncbi:hypothetical protein SAMD00019534_072500 [Acytostelium subglobosum LB1]|uniref:hypothetical protein n=1 Tax=Acytostelium subglobosum LB1 TaxID=1410327 RepID=UPI000644BA48|nr:hypothetical protein SAMD00019534_072500 [Acytostelium subglobosum LB1]GAM24075.1 hypothetical protein SAMD00019534_072500 [Acytostelium subglobosum LB1]|eukprot:XP_012753111.1 hypothetical protein SAMD00019534_072500 [Acytostelium subglobosum LB1]